MLDVSVEPCYTEEQDILRLFVNGISLLLDSDELHFTVLSTEGFVELNFGCRTLCCH